MLFSAYKSIPPACLVPAGVRRGCQIWNCRVDVCKLSLDCWESNLDPIARKRTFNYRIISPAANVY